MATVRRGPHQSNAVHADRLAPLQQKPRDFELSGGTGLVISDRTGQLQAFRHEGALDGADLKAYLERYGAPERAVTATETHSASRTSLYPSTPASVAQRR